MELLSLFDKVLETPTDCTTTSNCEECVDLFLSENEQTFAFVQFNIEYHNKLIKNLFQVISTSHTLSLKCLKLVRLLSRDKNLVLSIADIDTYVEHLVNLLKNDESIDNNVNEVESLKCLCNWVYHSSDVRAYIVNNDIMKEVIEIVSQSSDLFCDRLFFCLRLIFLISALEVDERNKMVEYNVVNSLIAVLDGTWEDNRKRLRSSLSIPKFLCEVLKALFNITLEFNNSSSTKVIDDCSRLVVVLRFLLIKLVPFKDSELDELLTHIAHMLVNIPKQAMVKLLVNADVSLEEQNAMEGQSIEKKTLKLYEHPVLFQGYDMTPAVILLSALDDRMKITNYMVMKEKTMAILTGFCYTCRVYPTLRKYLRQEVLPPLEMSSLRPEEHDDIRGRIVKLMTTVDVPLKNMAADFLFTLCKENVDRLVRYAGYGNSAGFLASFGLMVPSMQNADGDYSEDELSDFESGDIDMMIGAKAKPREDAFANLSESEKEIEADKLMSMIDRLSDMNVIKPMVLNKDGTITECKNFRSTDK